MIFEKIVFNIIALCLFTYVFTKMIKKNDTNYLPIIIIQALGILLNLIEIIIGNSESIIMKLFVYIFAIAVPVVIVLIERKGFNISEIIAIIKAKVFMMLKDPKDAKDVLIKLVTKYPESYIGHKMLAEIYEKEGGMRKAIDEYVMAIDVKKKDYDSYYKIAELLNDLEKKKEARHMLEMLLRNKGNYNKASLLLGDILCSQEDFKEAINVYMDALKFNPNDYDIYYNLGIVYTRLNDFQNAKECYEMAAELNSLEHKAQFNLGKLALLYRDMDAAETYFTESLYVDELESRSYYELAKISMLKGERDKAIAFANKAVEIEPELKELVDEEKTFIPIKVYIEEPMESEKEKELKRLSSKEEGTIEHMDKMYKLVEHMDLKDIEKHSQLIKDQINLGRERGQSS